MRASRVVSGWLALVVIYTVVQRGAAGRISGALGGLVGITKRLSDPSVALIPDIAGRSAAPSSPPKSAPGQEVPASFEVPRNV